MQYNEELNEWIEFGTLGTENGMSLPLSLQLNDQVWLMGGTSSIDARNIVIYDVKEGVSYIHPNLTRRGKCGRGDIL